MGTISYEEFGRRFVEQVVTADRVEATLQSVVSGSFDASVRQAGGLVRATGTGSVTKINVDLVEHDPALIFRARLHVDLSLTLKVSGLPYRYLARGVIVLELYPALREDLSIFVEVPDVTADAVDLELKPLGSVAALLDQLGSVKDQVRDEIVRFVNKRKDEPSAIEQRRIDIARTIDEEWARRRG